MTSLLTTEAGDFIEKLAGAGSNEQGDYYENGLLHCGVCHTPKQAEVTPSSGQARTVPVMCMCKEQHYADLERGKRESDLGRLVRELRRDGLTDQEYEKWTFGNDDGSKQAISSACRKYVDEWTSMKAENIGLLFYGGVGTGKSFYACCIANALLDKCVPALVTSAPRILSRIQAMGHGGGRDDALSGLQKYDLLVIDDLGTERGSEYALEQMFSAIDARYRCGKPLIVTTNLSPADIKSPANIAYMRIYDRIMQNSIPVKVPGDSRRKAIGAEKRRKYKGILGIGE
jgi:DNA replication protein DnaC